MFRVTESAAEQLKKIKDDVTASKPNSMLRLVPSGVGQFRLGVSTEPEPGDQEVYYQDEKVLVVDSQLSMTLSGVTLDFEERPEGGNFVLATSRQDSSR